MDKLKALLLPLALVFAAIAVFETGVRYGSTNMRAYAIASELQLPLNIFVQGQSTMNDANKEQLALLIDGNIATGSVHREIWFLDKKAKATLDKVLGYAFAVRGDAAIERFEDPDEAASKLMGGNPAKVLSALKAAKLELLDNAPSVAEKEAQESAETAAAE